MAEKKLNVAVEEKDDQLRRMQRKVDEAEISTKKKEKYVYPSGLGWSLLV